MAICWYCCIVDRLQALVRILNAQRGKTQDCNDLRGAQLSIQMTTYIVNNCKIFCGVNQCDLLTLSTRVRETSRRNKKLKFLKQLKQGGQQQHRATDIYKAIYRRT